MKCPVCKSDMMPLFTSYVCETCERMREFKYRGYIVLDVPEPNGQATYYVFPTYMDASKYQDNMTHGDGTVICRVALCTRPHWIKSTGTIKNLRLADNLYKIFPNENFDVGTYRGYVIERL